jgi:hypothetical protein
VPWRPLEPKRGAVLGGIGLRGCERVGHGPSWFQASVERGRRARATGRLLARRRNRPEVFAGLAAPGVFLVGVACPNVVIAIVVRPPASSA